MKAARGGLTGNCAKVGGGGLHVSSLVNAPGCLTGECEKVVGVLTRKGALAKFNKLRIGKAICAKIVENCKNCPT